jgi:1,4-alpha-glucan branching enzyme
MPGDDWQKFANLRLMFGYMFSQPGKKLLFMGGEFGQWDEWYHEKSLDWHLLEFPPHQGVKRWVEDLNRIYCQEPALHELDFDPAGFQWIDCSDVDYSVISFLRRGKTTNDLILVVANFTPVTHPNYRVGAPRPGYWQELLNGDATVYGGSGQGNLGGRETSPIPYHGYPDSLNLVLPPLAVVFFKNPG